MTLLILLIVSMVLSGIVLTTLALTFRKSWAEPYKIRPESGATRLTLAKTRLTSLSTSTLPPILVFGTAFGAYDHLFYDVGFHFGRAALHVVGILMLYDLLYYLAHRYLFHGPLMRKHHLVHHMAKYPQVQHSLHVHPLETLVGIALLLFCVWVVGPIHIFSFAFAFFVYSVLNLVIHCGMDFKRFPLRYFGMMARAHDAHHVSMRRKNFASITPLFDILFRTTE